MLDPPLEGTEDGIQSLRFGWIPSFASASNESITVTITVKYVGLLMTFVSMVTET